MRLTISRRERGGQPPLAPFWSTIPATWRSPNLTRALMRSLAALLALGAASPACADLPAAYFRGAAEEAQAGGDDSLSAEQPGVPWFERVQVRASIDDSERHEQSWAARLRLKTPSQIAAERKILNLQSQRGAIHASLAYSDALKRRFLLLVELDLHQRQLQLAETGLRLAQRGVRAQRAAAGSDAFRPSGLQQAELRLQDARRQLKLSALRLRRTRAQIAALIPSRPRAEAVESGELVAVADLAAALGLSPDAAYSSASDPAAMAGARTSEMDLALLEADIARQELARERGRGGFGLRFVELRHSFDDSNSSGDNRITIGVDMPLGKTFSSSSRRLQHNQAEYRKHRLHRRQQRERADLEQALALRMEEFELQQQSLKRMRSDLARRDSNTPVALTLALRRQQLDLRARQAALRADLYRDYIELLELRGQLAQQPLRNWLAVGQPTL